MDTSTERPERIGWRHYRIEGFMINVVSGIMVFHNKSCARPCGNYARSPQNAPATKEILWIQLMIIKPLAFKVELGIDNPTPQDFMSL